MPLPATRAVHPRLHDALRRSAVGDRGMPDRCRITRPGAGDGTLDPDTAVWSPPTGVLVFEGPCRIQPAGPRRGHQIEVGDDQVVLHDYRASIPWDAPQILVTDVLTVTGTHDPQLAGRPFVIRDVKYDTFQVRRYLDLDDHPDLATPEG